MLQGMGGGQARPMSGGLEPCTAPDAMQLVEGQVRSIQADDEAVYYIATEEGETRFLQGLVESRTGVVKRTSFATGETTTLYAPPVGNPLSQVYLSGDELFIYKNSYQPMTPDGGFIFRMPKSGGEPQLLGPLDIDPGFQEEAGRSGIMAVVGDELIVNEGYSNGVSVLSLVDGARRRLLNNTQGDQTTSMHVAEGRLWYSDGIGFGDLFYRDVASADAMPVVLYEGGCTEGGTLQLGRVWFRTSASGIYCGGSADIPLLALDGSGRTTAWEIPAARRYGSLNPLRFDGRTLYLGSIRHGVRLQLDTGEASIFACSAVGVDALAITRDRIVWGGGERTGLVNGQQLGTTEYEGIFVLPK